MILCDGSMVLMQAICLSFAKKNLKDTIDHYYNIASGQGKKGKILKCLFFIVVSATL